LIKIANKHGLTHISSIEKKATKQELKQYEEELDAPLETVFSFGYGI